MAKWNWPQIFNIVMRKLYPFEIDKEPRSFFTDDGVLVEIQETTTRIQYPRHWNYTQCKKWAELHEYPVPEQFGEGRNLQDGRWDCWNGNILGKLK